MEGNDSSLMNKIKTDWFNSLIGITSIAVISLCFIVKPTFLFAQGPQRVKETSHNLSSSGIGIFGTSDADVTEICVFCHTPHNADVKYPLWNRYSTTARTFTLYTSHTKDAQMPGDLAPDSASRLCLSCHDGITALNALVNYGTFGHKPNMILGADTLSDGADYEEGIGANIGTYLRNDHPVGFDYEIAQSTDGKLHPIAQVKAAGLKFFGSNGNFMECPTCHDPHVDYDYVKEGLYDFSGNGDYRYRPFLRKTNVSSELCFTCHNK